MGFCDVAPQLLSNPARGFYETLKKGKNALKDYIWEPSG
jgi:hypothetical protein